jgi:tetratricopeptide (TPR) repeat protein
MRQYDQALRELQRIQTRESNFPFVHRYLWICYHQKREFDKALLEARNFFLAAGKNEFGELIDRYRLKSGYKQVMRKLAEIMEKQSQNIYIQPVWIARLYAYACNTDKALEWLRMAYEERDSLMINLNSSIDWDNLRYHEEFKDLITLMKFPANSSETYG